MYWLRCEKVDGLGGGAIHTPTTDPSTPWAVWSPRSRRARWDGSDRGAISAMLAAPSVARARFEMTASPMRGCHYSVCDALPTVAWDVTP